MSARDDLIAACQVILASTLPPNADPLLVEQQTVARDLVLSAALFARCQDAQATATTREAWLEWQKFMDQEMATLRRLSDRMLQLAAAVEPPDRAQ